MKITMSRYSNFFLASLLQVSLTSCLFEEKKEFTPVVKDVAPIYEPRFNILINNYCVSKSTKRVSFNVLNRNYHLSSKGIIPDIDGDGVTDFDETAKVAELFGISPESADTNGDRYSDAVIYNGLLTLQKQGDLPQCGLEDFDFDGLPDCVENVIGTNNLLIDTDKDGISDELELYLGLSPLIVDSHVDTDMDGLSNFEELVIRTPMNESNHFGSIETYKLAYDLRITSSDSNEDCYSYQVNNITYVLKRNDIETNNLVEFYFIEDFQGQVTMKKYSKLILWSEVERLQKLLSETESGQLPTFILNYADLKAKD
jgi:hypothetical protein